MPPCPAERGDRRSGYGVLAQQAHGSKRPRRLGGGPCINAGRRSAAARRAAARAAGAKRPRTGTRRREFDGGRVEAVRQLEPGILRMRIDQRPADEGLDLRQQRSEDPLYFAIVDQGSGRASGLASYLRIDPPHGVIEVGHLAFSPLLQRTAAATEAMYLMMQNAFALGYRRYEWKCDSLNAASRRAAERLGFRFEGIFRQAVIYKGRSRDTAWYSIIDAEWPALHGALARWLEPGNFGADGRQRVSLGELARAARGGA